MAPCVPAGARAGLSGPVHAAFQCGQRGAGPGRAGVREAPARTRPGDAGTMQVANRTALPTTTPAPSTLAERVDRWRAEHGVLGVSVAIVGPDGSLDAAAAGLRDATAGASAPNHLTVDDRLRAASVSKTLTAAAVLDLVDRGRLSLDERLGDPRWFPRFPNADRITVEMLLRHTAGVPDYLASDAYARAADTHPLEPWGRREPIAAAAAMRPVADPGAGFSYSNTDYHLLGAIVEQVTGRTLGEYARERFLLPAGLTSAVVDEGVGAPAMTAPGHERDAASGVLEPITGIYERGSLYRSTGWADGQLVTTASELARWGADLLSEHGRALSPAARGALLASADMHREYGNGIYRVDLLDANGSRMPTYGHNGSDPGYRSLLLHAPSTGRTVAIQANQRPIDEDAMLDLAEELLRQAPGPRVQK